MIAGPGPWLFRTRIDEFERHAVSDFGRALVGKESDNLIFECRRNDLIGVQIQDPMISAMILGETLLSPKAKPALRYDACPLAHSHPDGVI